MSEASSAPYLIRIKSEIASSYPDFEERVTQAWADILDELKTATQKISAGGPEFIPQVQFSELDSLPADKIDEIRRKSCLVIKDIVDDAQAIAWKKSLEDFITANPDADGSPVGDKQFYRLYWTKPQLEARAHPNMLATSVWLNNLYHAETGQKLDGVDLTSPLTYADCFRFRHPGIDSYWAALLPPHVDGGTIERWEDPTLRSCFADIFSGQWRKHDPYALVSRVGAQTSLYGRPMQGSIFRTFQGWLAMSETGPTEGTLQVFPDILLSNTYMILRPFFRLLVEPDSPEVSNPKSWAFDASSADFPGLLPRDGGWYGPHLTPELHPNLLLEETMISMPKVFPGDAVFWHADVVHSVEKEHTGNCDSAVMYIPAVPTTLLNQAYIKRQKETFLNAVAPPDFPVQMKRENELMGFGKPCDILNPLGRKAMGLSDYVA
ncbi:DUF1479-domain-containing protein [Guyanagaster necrorhizus]|uniref:DUF1479-domain-containing protein n=1 Tax=Guyanagaster necrorhizus TaxID=856835 RepID=A0A9P8ALF6_9AGAR|nr:DUF1479-domain-containing protein [Guyanagaster necrorhizus MCA 3950]KAG7439596.1 DUF1479-domain-containing protein [Guyanagaster necrorhizus MCA 3950]